MLRTVGKLKGRLTASIIEWAKVAKCSTELMTCFSRRVCGYAPRKF